MKSTKSYLKARLSKIPSRSDRLLKGALYNTIKLSKFLRVVVVRLLTALTTTTLTDLPSTAESLKRPILSALSKIFSYLLIYLKHLFKYAIFREVNE